MQQNVILKLIIISKSNLTKVTKMYLSITILWSNMRGKFLLAFRKVALEVCTLRRPWVLLCTLVTIKCSKII